MIVDAIYESVDCEPVSVMRDGAIANLVYSVSPTASSDISWQEHTDVTFKASTSPHCPKCAITSMVSIVDLLSSEFIVIVVSHIIVYSSIYIRILVG